MNQGKPTYGKNAIWSLSSRLLTPWAILPLLTLSLLLFGTRSDNSTQPAASDEPPQDYSPPTKTLSKSATLNMYEGLPDPDTESDLYKQELAAKKTLRVTLGTYPLPYDFYETPLTVSPEDTEKLLALFTANNTFADRWLKRCGFHPDYYLVWNEEGITYEVMLCFTCRQARFSTAEQRPVDAIIQMHRFDEFAVILNKYVKQRPPKKTRK